jgi:hypothetical protein
MLTNDRLNLAVLQKTVGTPTSDEPANAHREG